MSDLSDLAGHYVRSSMLHWHPLVRDLDIPQPETRIVEIPYRTLSGVMDGERALGSHAEELYAALEDLEPYPVFLRTDHSSQKHMFRRTCRLPSRRALLPHLMEILDLNACFDLVDSAVVLRKWLDLDAGFCAFDRLPISVEARAFVSGGEPRCVHPYWVPDAVAAWAERGGRLARGMDPGWRGILEWQNRAVAAAGATIAGMAREVARRVGGAAWSVDFARGRDGRWYLIDMAAAEVSYHPPGCGEIRWGG